MNLRAVLLSFYFLFNASVHYSQSDIRHLDSDRLITSKYHSQFFTDSNGKLWIGSIGSISTWDGHQITNYLPDENSFDGEYVMSNFFEAENQNIYFTTEQGIFYFDRKQRIFKKVHTKENTPVLTRYGIHMDTKFEELWMTEDTLLIKTSILSDSSNVISTTNSVNFDIWKNSTGDVQTIIGCPWRNGPGIELYVRDSFEFQKYSLVFNDSLQEFSDVKIQNDSIAWLVYRTGLSKVNYVKKTKIKDISIDHDGILLQRVSWKQKTDFLVNSTAGVWNFNLNEEKFQLLLDKTDGLNSNTIQKTYLDHQDNLWISYPNNARVEHTWIESSPFKNALEFPVRGMIEDDDGNIWCISKSNLILVFDNGGNLLKELYYDSKRSTAKRPGQFDLTISKDEHGTIWVSEGRNLYRSTASFNFDHVAELENREIRQVLHLAHNQKVLLTNRGISSLINTDSTVLIQSANTIPLNFDQASAVFQISNEEIIVPDVNRNFSQVLKSENHQLVAVETIPEAFFVNSMIVDNKRGGVWIGNSYGLSFFNGIENKPVKIDGSRIGNGIVSNVVLDHSGNVWFTSGMAIYKYLPEEKLVYIFRKEEGYVSDNFNRLSNVVTSTGHIWFGHDQGAVFFHPDSIKVNPYGPIMSIDKLTINNEFYPIGPQDSTLNLEHDQSNLSIDIVGAHYHNQQFSEIKYQVEGLTDDGWIYTKNPTTLNYSFTPGSYTLRMVGINANKVEGEEKRLQINIAIPFWQTWWFRLSALAIFGGIIYGSAQWYSHRQLVLQQKVFEQEKQIQLILQNERNRVAGEMHDDLGGGLTTIRLTAQKLKEKENGNTPVEMEKIEQTSVNLLASMREIIWAMNSRNDNAIDLLSHLRKYAIEFFEPTDTSVDVQLPDPIPKVLVSGAQRRNIYLCLKESLHNIVKHAKAKKVTLKIGINKEFTMWVQDDGIGIANAHESLMSHGLENMSERMEDINGTFEMKQKNGTILIFTFPIVDNIYISVS